MNLTMRALKAQLKAELLRTIRNRRFVIFTILMPAMFYFIFTGTVGDTTQVGGSDWKAYYLMSMTAYGVIGASMTTMAVRFSRERAQGWNKLVRLTPLPSYVQLLAKIFSQGALNMGIIVFLFLLGAFVKDVELSAAQWVESGLWIWVGGFAFMSLGTLLGTIRNVELVQVVSNLVYMAMSVAGGLWMPTTVMPDLMQTISKFLPTYRLGQGAWDIVGGSGSIPWASVGILVAYVLVFMFISTYIMKKQEAV
ncbi:ABC-2 type transport system permease protein [Paenibacillus phyllosphaerae]|uniref:ABC-2 type transport system permease protein n=1 Tax=Paenibacillus phyllosphaerae TaxID=274593 RepID=A0A7W5FPD2_9BACL|nr:ABC transporter permease [Paenibacillus phyllosphaerae]MBB3112225.1 ABC-2 type transport system permease protein [Paenibacillus phyllosphaerae]